MDISKIRKEYSNAPLNKKDLAPDPFVQFEQWLSDAKNANLVEFNAMVLATANKNGVPSTRVVLLKKLDRRSLIFFTNYESQKANNIRENPFVSVTFFWKELERQINIEGKAEILPHNESEKYFQSRPRNSKIGTWASRQDNVLSSREELEKAYEMYSQKFKDQEIPMPEYWGGYRITPTKFSFWQGRENRLHDRFCYQKQEKEKWIIQRLSP